MMCPVLILIDQGFTFGTIAVATFMYSVVSACTEIPAGLIVDRLPRLSVGGRYSSFGRVSLRRQPVASVPGDCRSCSRESCSSRILGFSSP